MSWPLLISPKDFLLLIIWVRLIEGKASPTHKACCKQVQLQQVLSLPRHYKGVLEKYSVIKYTKCLDVYPKDCAHRSQINGHCDSITESAQWGQYSENIKPCKRRPEITKYLEPYHFLYIPLTSGSKNKIL